MIDIDAVRRKILECAVNCEHDQQKDRRGPLYSPTRGPDQDSLQ